MPVNTYVHQYWWTSLDDQKVSTCRSCRTFVVISAAVIQSGECSSSPEPISNPLVIRIEASRLRGPKNMCRKLTTFPITTSHACLMLYLGILYSSFLFQLKNNLNEEGERTRGFFWGDMLTRDWCSSMKQNSVFMNVNQAMWEVN